MARVLLGVSGGIAAYKAIDSLRALQRAGHDVHVVMTRGATHFVGAPTFAALSGNHVGSELFGDVGRPDYRHLDLARGTDVMVVAPATANTIARMAAGLGDDLLTSTYLAYDGPVMVAPAMNTRMWEHPATVANIATLAGRGVHVIPPGDGLLADGDIGAGRLAETEDIVAAVEAVLATGESGQPTTGTLANQRVLITAGGTREPIDSVRFVGNRSSGRMGFAIADAAAERGADVTVIAANVDLPRNPRIRYIDVERADQLLDATRALFPGCDALVMAAAVADFRPVVGTEGKIDKSATSSLVVHMEPTTDILTTLAGERTHQTVVGFAAEHGPAGLQRARDKRRRKQLDVIVHNDISQPGIGFEGTENAITIIGPGDAEFDVPRMSKRQCANRILDAIAPLLAG